MAQEPDAALLLTAQLCSKLCHDLAGVIGAIANGAELLEDEDDEEIRKQAVELLAQSATQAGRRLRFFRIAFGAGGALGDAIDMSELREAAEGQFGGGRLKIEWPAEIARLTKAQAKLLFNLLLVAAAGLPRGGFLRPSIAADGAVGVMAEGDGANIPEAVQSVLAGPAGLPEGIAAVALHALRLAAGAGQRVTAATAGPKGFSLTLKPV
jgi:histidine phosphotransferase ChpT